MKSSTANSRRAMQQIGASPQGICLCSVNPESYSMALGPVRSSTLHSKRGKPQEDREPRQEAGVTLSHCRGCRTHNKMSFRAILSGRLTDCLHLWSWEVQLGHIPRQQLSRLYAGDQGVAPWWQSPSLRRTTVKTRGLSTSIPSSPRKSPLKRERGLEDRDWKGPRVRANCASLASSLSVCCPPTWVSFQNGQTNPPLCPKYLIPGGDGIRVESH